MEVGDDLKSLMELIGLSAPVITFIAGLSAIVGLILGHYKNRNELRLKNAQELQENIPKLQDHFSKHLETVVDPDGPPLGDPQTESNLLRLARRSSTMAVDFMRAERGWPILRWIWPPARFLSGADYAALANVLAVLRDRNANRLFEHSIDVANDSFAKTLNSRLHFGVLYQTMCIDQARDAAKRSTGFMERMIEEASAPPSSHWKLPLANISLPRELQAFGRTISINPEPPKGNGTPSHAHLQGVIHHTLIANFELTLTQNETEFAHHLAAASSHLQQITTTLFAKEALGYMHEMLFGALLPAEPESESVLKIGKENNQYLALLGRLSDALTAGDAQAASKSDEASRWTSYLAAVQARIAEDWPEFLELARKAQAETAAAEEKQRIAQANALLAQQNMLAQAALAQQAELTRIIQEQQLAEAQAEPSQAPA